MRTKAILFLLIGFFVLFNSCDPDDEEGISMRYDETKCDNPWATLPEEGDYLVDVRYYLEQQGITVLSIFVSTYDENIGEGCDECSCLTGRHIVISIPTEDAYEAEDLGFYVY